MEDNNSQIIQKHQHDIQINDKNNSQSSSNGNNCQNDRLIHQGLQQKRQHFIVTQGYEESQKQQLEFFNKKRQEEVMKKGVNNNAGLFLQEEQQENRNYQPQPCNYFIEKNVLKNYLHKKTIKEGNANKQIQIVNHDQKEVGHDHNDLQIRVQSQNQNHNCQNNPQICIQHLNIEENQIKLQQNEEQQNIEQNLYVGYMPDNYQQQLRDAHGSEVLLEILNNKDIQNQIISERRIQQQQQQQQLQQMRENIILNNDSRNSYNQVQQQSQIQDKQQQDELNNLPQAQELSNNNVQDQIMSQRNIQQQQQISQQQIQQASGIVFNNDRKKSYDQVQQQSQIQDKQQKNELNSQPQFQKLSNNIIANQQQFNNKFVLYPITSQPDEVYIQNNNNQKIINNIGEQNITAVFNFQAQPRGDNQNRNINQLQIEQKNSVENSNINQNNIEFTFSNNQNLLQQPIPKELDHNKKQQQFLQVVQEQEEQEESKIQSNNMQNNNMNLQNQNNSYHQAQQQGINFQYLNRQGYQNYQQQNQSFNNFQGQQLNQRQNYKNQTTQNNYNQQPDINTNYQFFNPCQIQQKSIQQNQATYYKNHTFDQNPRYQLSNNSFNQISQPQQNQQQMLNGYSNLPEFQENQPVYGQFNNNNIQNQQYNQFNFINQQQQYQQQQVMNNNDNQYSYYQQQNYYDGNQQQFQINQNLYQQNQQHQQQQQEYQQNNYGFSMNLNGQFNQQQQFNGQFDNQNRNMNIISTQPKIEQQSNQKIGGDQFQNQFMIQDINQNQNNQNLEMNSFYIQQTIPQTHNQNNVGESLQNQLQQQNNQNDIGFNQNYEYQSYSQDINYSNNNQNYNQKPNPTDVTINNNPGLTQFNQINDHKIDNNNFTQNLINQAISLNNENDDQKQSDQNNQNILLYKMEELDQNLDKLIINNNSSDQEYIIKYGGRENIKETKLEYTNIAQGQQQEFMSSLKQFVQLEFDCSQHFYQKLSQTYTPQTFTQYANEMYKYNEQKKQGIIQLQNTIQGYEYILQPKKGEHSFFRAAMLGMLIQIFSRNKQTYQMNLFAYFSKIPCTNVTVPLEIQSENANFNNLNLGQNYKNYFLNCFLYLIFQSINNSKIECIIDTLLKMASQDIAFDFSMICYSISLCNYYMPKLVSNSYYQNFVDLLNEQITHYDFEMFDIFKNILIEVLRIEVRIYIVQENREDLLNPQKNQKSLICSLTMIINEHQNLLLIDKSIANYFQNSSLEFLEQEFTNVVKTEKQIRTESKDEICHQCGNQLEFEKEAHQIQDLGSKQIFQFCVADFLQLIRNLKKNVLKGSSNYKFKLFGDDFNIEMNTKDVQKQQQILTNMLDHSQDCTKNKPSGLLQFKERSCFKCAFISLEKNNIDHSNSTKMNEIRQFQPKNQNKEIQKNVPKICQNSIKKDAFVNHQTQTKFLHQNNNERVIAFDKPQNLITNISSKPQVQKKAVNNQNFLFQRDQLTIDRNRNQVSPQKLIKSSKCNCCGSSQNQSILIKVSQVSQILQKYDLVCAKCVLKLSQSYKLLFHRAEKQNQFYCFNCGSRFQEGLQSQNECKQCKTLNSYQL